MEKLLRQFQAQSPFCKARVMARIRLATSSDKAIFLYILALSSQYKNDPTIRRFIEKVGLSRNDEQARDRFERYLPELRNALFQHSVAVLRSLYQ